MPDHCMGTCSKTSGSAACFFCSTTTDRSTRQLSKATAMTWHWQPISPKLIVSHHAADCVSRQHASRSQDCPRTPLEPKQPSPRAEYTSNQVHAGSTNSGNHCLISEQRLLKHIDQNHRATNQTRAATPLQTNKIASTARTLSVKKLSDQHARNAQPHLRRVTEIDPRANCI